MRTALLDAWRAVLLAWTALVVAAPLLLRRLLGLPLAPAAVGARVRGGLERLGVTYVKLGQFLAMRFDILPEEVCRELARLFDAVPPIPLAVVREVIESELQRPLETLFASFDPQCLAAASVAQVHRATLPGGEVVAVKVQRPGIERLFAADVRNLRRAARLGDRLRLLGPQSLLEGLGEFEAYTRREMDFTVEARTAERLRRDALPFERAPRIDWERTTPRVLTMEFMAGLPLSDVIQLVESGRLDELERRAPGLDLQTAVQNLASACLRQLFVSGFFHGDPHPGNVFLGRDGSVAFVDFGIFGRLTDERREALAAYIESLSFGDVELSYRQFARVLEPTPFTDFQGLRRDVQAIMRRWYEASRTGTASMQERHLGTYFSEFLAAVRRREVRMGFDTLLFWRALITLNSTALRFRGQFDLLSALREFFQANRPSPLERLQALAHDGQRRRAIARVVGQGPRQAARLLEDLSSGAFALETHATPRDHAAGGAAPVAAALVALSAALLLGGTPAAACWGDAAAGAALLAAACVAGRRPA